MSRRKIFVVIRILVFAALIALLWRQVQLRDRITILEDGRDVTLYGTVVDETPEQTIFKTDSGVIRLVSSEILKERPHYGLLSLVKRLDLSDFGVAILCMAGTYLINVLRWYLLCRARNLGLTPRNATRFTLLGLFFNNAVPGATGGDVMKAYLASQDLPSKAPMVASVFLDRIIGLIALICLAGGVLVFQLGDPAFQSFATNVFLLLGAIVVVGIIYYSRRLRRILGLTYIGSKLPFKGMIHKLDQGFFEYRYHKNSLLVAFAVSFVAHGFTMLSHIMIGKALRMDVPIVAYFIYVPIGQVASALPIFPGGWGVREATYGILFQRAGVPLSHGVALGFLHGFVVLGWSLLGGLLFLRGTRDIPATSMDEILESPGEGSAKPKPAGPKDDGA